MAPSFVPFLYSYVHHHKKVNMRVSKDISRNVDMPMALHFLMIISIQSIMKEKILIYTTLDNISYPSL
jgi:hypothetical protein